MGAWMLTLAASVIVIFGFWLIVSRNLKSQKKMDTYTCEICDDRDCECHKAIGDKEIGE